jgi:hypothetical protein
MFLLYFLSVLFLLVICLLLVPIILFIDTNTNQYYIQFKGLAKVSIEANEEEILKIKLKLLFMNFDFYPLTKHKKRNKKTHLTKAKSKKKQNRFNLKTGLRLLKTFKVKQFVMAIDTGDCIYNAKLYPVFAFLNYRIGNFNINFVGRNQLVLHLENRPIYILKSFIKL